jgi:hypothetical protein
MLPWLTRLFADTRIGTVIVDGRNATSQSTLRITVVLLIGLLLITGQFGTERARAGRRCRGAGAARERGRA